MIQKEKKKKRKIKTLTKSMNNKLIVTLVGLLLFFVGTMAWLSYVSLFNGKKYQKKALSQQTYVSNVIPYKRGSILDRRETVLAHSIVVYNLVLEPAKISSKAYLSKPTLELISRHFDLPLEDLHFIMEEKADSYYVVLKKNISFDEKTKFLEEVESFNKRDTSNEKGDSKKEKIDGYWFEEYYKREYPRKEVASDLIGFTNSGNVGNWGLEEYYNDVLNGRNGRKYGYFNSNRELEETELLAKHGYSIKTSLDSDAQKMTEDIIAKFMEEEGAKNVGVLIMNPNNGDIYTMASDKQFDPNEPRKLSAYYKEEEIEKMTDEEKLNALNGIWRNFCLSDVYEPGSTFKPFTVAACLEQKVAKKDEVFLCNGFEDVIDRKIHCVRREGHGALNLSESLQQSCNDVMMQISAKLGRKEFSRYQGLFGIGTRTGIDLPGESMGIAYEEAGMNPVELATSSFGQGVSVTMLQIAAGISSIINGGTYYRPRVVTEIVNDSGMTVEHFEPVVMRKTVTKSTADFIKEALYQTVEQGTGKRVKTEGYEVGGKTGTAQKFEQVKGVGKVRSDKDYLLSFVGFAPFDKPEALVYVIVDEPKVEDQARSGKASTLASEIIKKVFPVLGVYPDESLEKKKEE